MTTRKKWSPDELSPEFWNVIGQVKGSRQALQPIVQKMEQGDLYEFYREYEAARLALLAPAFFKAGLSEDNVEDMAEWAVAQGRDKYRDLWAHPEKMPLDPPDESGEGFGDLINRTFRERFGQDLYELFYGG
jgi:hypothetical protein